MYFEELPERPGHDSSVSALRISQWILICDQGVERRQYRHLLFVQLAKSGL